jgi:hypothetical protein
VGRFSLLGTWNQQVRGRVYTYIPLTDGPQNQRPGSDPWPEVPLNYSSSHILLWNLADIYSLTLNISVDPEWSASSLELLAILSLFKNWHPNVIVDTFFLLSCPSLVPFVSQAYLWKHLSLKMEKNLKHLMFCNLPMLWKVQFCQFWRWSWQGYAGPQQ